MTPEVVVVGTINLDRTVRVPHLPARGETVLGGALQVHPGGKGANQAVAAARLGAVTALVGCVGDDADGDLVLRALRAEARLDVSGVVRRSGEPTGAALIAVEPAGDNMVVTAPGANASLTEDVVHRHGRVIASGRVLLVQLGTPLDGVRAACEIARSVGTTTVLDPAPVRDLPRDVWRLVDVVKANELEAEQLTGVTVVDARSATGAARALVALGATAAIVTMGARGAVLVSGGQALEEAAPRVSAIDCTAAGDAFAGALATTLARGASLSEAVGRGVRAGALATTMVGAYPSLPTAAMLDDLPR